MVQQIILQNTERPTSDIIDPENEKAGLDTVSIKKKIQDPDHSIIEIDVKKIVQLLVKEEELVAARTKAEEMEKDNLEMQSKMAKKEQELDLRTQEKEDLETGLARMRERLEKESANHSQTVQRALNAEMKIEDLQHKYAQEQHERMRLERLVTEGSIPDDQKISGLIGTNGLTTPGSDSKLKSIPTAPAPLPPIPPPPPMMCTGPPPPPAPKAPLTGSTTTTIIVNYENGEKNHQFHHFNIVFSSIIYTNGINQKECATTKQSIEEFQLVKTARCQSSRNNLERTRRHEIVFEYRIGKYRQIILRLSKERSYCKYTQ